jgi:hypothetical protein
MKDSAKKRVLIYDLFKLLDKNDIQRVKIDYFEEMLAKVENPKLKTIPSEINKEEKGYLELEDMFLLLKELSIEEIN